MSDLFRPLRQPMFRRMFGATLVANLGFYVQDVTLAWLIASVTRSPSLVSMVAAAGMLPVFLLSLPAGALGDAVNRRSFLIVTQSLVVLIVLSLAATIWLGKISAIVLILFALTTGTLNAIAGPARQSVLPSIVDEADLPSAVQLNSIGFNGSRAFGPMIGGLVLAAFGPVVAILSYVVGCIGVLLAFVSWREAPPKPERTERLHESLMSGLRYIGRRTDLRDGFIMAGAYFFCMSPLWAFVPLVAKGFADGNTRIFSLFVTCIGLGAAIGGVLLRPAQRGAFGISFRNGCMVSGVALAAIAASQSLVFTLLGFFVAGLGWIGITSGIQAFAVMNVDPLFRSRVISKMMIALAGGMSLGSLTWGQVASVIGTHATFGIGAGLMLVLALLATRFDPTRGLVLRRPPPVPTPIPVDDRLNFPPLS